MVNAQEWLDKKYSKKETTKIRSKYSFETIEGELVIECFPNLQKIDVGAFRQGKLTKLKIINCPKLCELNCENNQLKELEIDKVSRQQLKKINFKRNSKLNLTTLKTFLNHKQTDHSEYKEYKKNKRVFLGGTCNDSTWREELIPQLNSNKISYFNPVVLEWNEQAQQEELHQRAVCDFVLYVITREAEGFYATAEVVDDSNKRPEKTVFCYLKKGFSEHQVKSLRAIERMVEENGAKVFKSLKEIAEYLNGEGEESEDLEEIKWENLNFTSTEAKVWKDINCNEELAYYCRSKGLTSQEVKNDLSGYKKKLQGELKKVQDYLDFFYPSAQRSKIKKLDISNKNLEDNLDLKGFNNLIYLNCSNNKLTNLGLSDCVNLTELNCSNNELSKLNFLNVLLPFNKLVNLDLSYNSCSGSLAFLSNCPNLKNIKIWGDNKLDSDFQYLPSNLESISCNKGKIEKELALYGNSLITWQEVHLNLMKAAGKQPIVIDFYKSEPKKVTTTPKYLNLKDELDSNKSTSSSYECKLNYQHLTLSDSKKPFSWKKNSQSPPLRLYNLDTKRVETTKDKINIFNYAVLSYVWGQDWEKDSKSYGQTYQTDLTKLGRKALNKVIKATELINRQKNENLKEINPKITEEELQKSDINYIWIDNFCINQSDKEEQGQENWGGIQEVGELNNPPTIFITPLGWSYGAKLEQKVELSLCQALDAIKLRQSTVAIDGLYSILGLLPYGNKINTESHYKEQGHVYKKGELEKALLDMMKVAMDNGHPYEPLFWWGSRQDKPQLWWIPEVDEKGRCSKIEKVSIEEIENCQITDYGVKLDGYEEVESNNIKIYPANKVKAVTDFEIEILEETFKEKSKKVIFRPRNNDIFYREERKPSPFFINLVDKEVISLEQAETHQVIDLDKHFEKKEQLQTQIEIPSK